MEAWPFAEISIVFSFFSVCSDGSGCLIYLFLSEALGNSVLHSSVITHLKQARKQGYCFNEEELFDEGKWRKV